MTALVLAVLAQQAAAPAAPSTPPPEPRLIVIGPVYQPNGTVNGETISLPGTTPSVVYVFSRRTLCETATITSTEPTDAGFGWRLAAHVVSATPTEVAVSVDWRRLWDGGQRLKTGPAGTAQLSLHPGDRIPLDHISNVRPSESCRAVGMGLEVRLGHVPAPRKPGEVTLPLGAREGGAGQLDVDLWLVHTSPSGGEQAQHQKVRLSSSGGPFTFAPVRFATRQGDVGVELNGSFLRYTSAGGSEFLLLNMSRVVTGGTAPAGGLPGSTSSFVPLPRGDEVLSFEMLSGGGFGARARAGGAGGARSGGGGAVRSGGSGQAGGRGGGMAGASPEEREKALSNLTNAMQVTALLDGHRFALRVKVTPVPGS
ncbi:MAG TPA: hypothetical protein VFO31_06535 [Vicinamibacterales bacterium]|nr:hypothetical protein [Vicinamibacterales bacterium]